MAKKCSLRTITGEYGSSTVWTVDGVSVVWFEAVEALSDFEAQREDCIFTSILNTE
jgi:hypothetical protein